MKKDKKSIIKLGGNNMYIELKDDKVTIPKDKYDVEKEISYLNFVLGYDLLNDMLKKSDTPECDVSYDFCDYVSRHFIVSEEYRNEKFSTYEMLQTWINKNKDKLETKYKSFIGEEIEQRNNIELEKDR